MRSLAHGTGTTLGLQLPPAHTLMKRINRAMMMSDEHASG